MTPCVECARVMAEGQFCCRLYGRYHLCSQACVESFRANFKGRDFVAAQDQALTSVSEVLDGRPRNFILLYADNENTIGTCMMAAPEFVTACIPVLMEAMTMEGDIEPPID
jgi:hypothetical protein